MEEISTKCPAGHKHFRTERKLTKQSAVYHPQLAASLAGHIAAALGQRSKEEDDRAELRLEKIVNNDAFFRPEWKVGSEGAGRDQLTSTFLKAVLLLDFCELSPLKEESGGSQPC